MIILSTSTIAQSLSVIPRAYSGDFTMSIRDDSTNKTKVYQIADALQVGNYLKFTNIFNPILPENHFFDLHLFCYYIHVLDPSSKKTHKKKGRKGKKHVTKLKKLSKLTISLQNLILFFLLLFKIKE